MDWNEAEYQMDVNKARRDEIIRDFFMGLIVGSLVIGTVVSLLV